MFIYYTKQLRALPDKFAAERNCIPAFAGFDADQEERTAIKLFMALRKQNHFTDKALPSFIELPHTTNSGIFIIQSTAKQFCQIAYIALKLISKAK